MSVNFEALLESSAEWQAIHQGAHNTVYRSQHYAIKKYAERTSAEREFAVLQGLRDFGINLGPEALFLAPDQPIVIMNWLQGDTLRETPALHDETLWHRLMAAMGASGEMPYGPYQKQIPSQGKGFFQPADMLAALDSLLQNLGENHPDYERLTLLVARVHQQTAPQWDMPAKIGLCRRDHDLHNFLWDGHHLLALDWENADWGDMASDVGLWSAHPAYETIPSSHWVWLRWEFSRLTHDATFTTRSTLYARLAQVWWALHLSADSTQTALRDRYLQRAQKIFVT